MGQALFIFFRYFRQGKTEGKNEGFPSKYTILKDILIYLSYLEHSQIFDINITELKNFVAIKVILRLKLLYLLAYPKF